jgi:hypothetical protein
VSAARSLGIGQTSAVLVNARDVWNDTGIVMERGASYGFVATGAWRDASWKSGPGGIDGGVIHRLAARWRRIPTSRWFCLIGEVHASDEPIEGSALTALSIGEGGTFQSLYAGRLFAYANDVRLGMFPSAFYLNNHGSVSLRVTRTS